MQLNSDELKIWDQYAAAALAVYAATLAGSKPANGGVPGAADGINSVAAAVAAASIADALFEERGLRSKRRTGTSVPLKL